MRRRPGDRGRISLRRTVRIFVLVTLGFAIAWGVRVAVLEGFIYEWPRHFKGDFYNAMFGAWNGEGIYYGPVFVMEHWLVKLSPQVFNEYFFAVLNVPLFVLAFIFATKAVRLGWDAAVLAAAAWVCFQWVPYAFSVAANPEILELTLLCAAWYAASRRTSLGLAATAAAALTKRIPVVFLPLVIMVEPTRRSLVVGALLVAGAVTVGLGFHVGPDTILRATGTSISLLLQQTGSDGFLDLPADNVPSILAQPFPYPSQFLGLSNALARLFARSINDWPLPFFQGFYYVVTVAVLGFATYLAYALIHGRHRIPRRQAEILSFAFFFALMPLVSITTHPHTFIFLLPTWTGFIALVALEPDVWRKRGLAALAVVCYFFMGFPAPVVLVDRYLGTHLWLSAAFQDPIWANMVLLLGLFAYGSRRLFDHSAVVEEASLPSPTSP
jgi:hypothetical protein